LWVALKYPSYVNQFNEGSLFIGRATALAGSAHKTMCDTKDDAQKWKCEICTYENYPSSLKCTMCQASKPLLNEDIFR